MIPTSTPRDARATVTTPHRPREPGRSEHLLLVTHHYEPESGAPQRRWSTLVPRFVNAGYRVSVVAPPPHYPAGVLDPEHAGIRPGLVQHGAHGEEIFRVRYREHSSSLVSRAADQLVAATHSVLACWRQLHARTDRPTVVVGTVPGIPSIFAAWALARLFRARFVVEMRDAWPDLIRPAGAAVDSSGRRARALLIAVVHRTIVRMQSRSDLVVTTTERFAEVVAGRGARRVGVVRNGTAFTDRLTQEARIVDGVPDDDSRTGTSRPLRVAYAGTIGRSQGLEVAVRAAAALAARGVAVDVRLAGTGVDVEHLAALATALDAPVTFLGRVPHADVPRLYAWADTVLVSLRDWGPFEWTVPSKLYEAMATRRHVTACLAGEAAELVRSLEAGDVVSPGDVDGLAELWGRLVGAGAGAGAGTGAGLEVGRTAQDWVFVHADDDALAARYIGLLDGLRP